MTKSRIEAFSDGVMAIVLTIMVLEMKVPHDSKIESLLALYPIFISYALSFGLVAIYWANHHHLMHTVTHVGSKMIWLNMGLLFSLSLIPLTTGWMGENHFDRTPVLVYILNNLLCAASYFFFQKHILYSQSKNSELCEALKKQNNKGLLTLFINIAAIPAAYLYTPIAVLFLATITILWAIPDKNIERALR